MNSDWSAGVGAQAGHRAVPDKRQWTNPLALWLATTVSAAKMPIRELLTTA
jgi:hypothetical protein